MRSPSRSRRARTALIALAVLAGASAQTPAPAAPQAWCLHLPLPAAERACRVLVVRAPRGTMRLAVASTELQRERGLMNVTYVPAGQGMLFAFADGDQNRGFWMKDTVTPLDMVFVSSDGSITDVAVNVPATSPKTPDDKIARRNGVGKYVIELGAGDAGRLGLLPGARIVIPAIPAQ